jgi:uroporphyrinogen decarboxylase
MVLREWMGPEGLLYAFMDRPTLVHEMLEFYTSFLEQLLDRALRDVDIDYVSFSEDMAYKGGPFLSPTMFREFFFPRYYRLARLIRDHGVETFAVDSDGYPEPLVPLLLHAGVNCIHPCEVAAGMDVVELRKEYGTDLRLWCGIDKRALSQGEAAIDAELEARIPPMLETGGYIPQIDHSVPPDVPYENFCHYWERLRELSGGE